MNVQELKPLPKGLLKIVAYTQLCEAIKKDFGIELPMKSGEETTRAVEEILGIRTSDPMLEELAVALQQMADIYYGRDNQPIAGAYARAMDGALQKYQQSKVQP